MAEWFTTGVAVYLAIGFCCAVAVSYSDPGCRDPKTVGAALGAFFIWPPFLALFLAVWLGQFLALNWKKKV